MSLSDQSNPSSRARGGLRRYALALALCLAGTAAAAAPLKVVTSFSLLEDITRQVGGEQVEVATLVGRNADAHAYEPTPGDARKLAGAQLLVVNGLQFETWLDRLQRASGFKGKTVVASEGITPLRFSHGDEAHDHDHEHEKHDHDHKHDHKHKHDHDHDHDHDHGHDHGKAKAKPAADAHAHHDHGEWDPHAWQSLANGARYARNIAEALASADPANAQAYRQRAQAYAQKLEAVDARLKRDFAALPAERRKAVISHEAFGYFGQAYGLTFVPVAGLSTAAEPSAADVARIVAQVRKEKVPALFVENVSSPRLVEQIARETGAKVGGTLYSDALSEPGQPAATYLDLFEWNAKQFLDALRP